jgi:hypothetical protein
MSMPAGVYVPWTPKIGFGAPLVVWAQALTPASEASKTTEGQKHPLPMRRHGIMGTSFHRPAPTRPRSDQ